MEPELQNSLTQELNAMSAIGKVLGELTDPSARERVLRWAAERFQVGAPVSSEQTAVTVRPEAVAGDPMLAVELGATFVARSFSGDKKQLLSLLKAALAHRGTVMLDVISPCVTFNDHEGSTKSYAYVKDHDDPVEEVSFVPYFEDIAVDYEPGTTQEVTMHDGSKLYLKKLEEDYDPTDKIAALKRLHETSRRGEFATGLIYIEPDRDDFLTQLNVVDEPLATLPLSRTRPGPEALEEIMEGLR